VGGTPADGAHWTTFSDAVVTAEALIHSSNITIVSTTGYAAGSAIPVFSKTYSTAGSRSAAGVIAAGDVCGLIRYATAARTSKNHPIYLFNYYHGPTQQPPPNQDKLDSGWVTAYGTYASAWDSTGFSDGTLTLKRAGPNGASATGHIVETYVTHRDFPR
jgi:hypothetical protein